MDFAMCCCINSSFLLLFKGGGTHDVSIVTVTNKFYAVQTTEGDSWLGGQDFTRNLAVLCAKKLKSEYDIDLESTTIVEICEKIKRSLSFEDKVTIPVCDFVDGYRNSENKITVTRSEFEEQNEQLFKATIDRVKWAMLTLNFTTEEMDHVILTGGSSRMPKIHSLLLKLFNNDESKIVKKECDLNELGMYLFIYY